MVWQIVNGCDFEKAKIPLFVRSPYLEMEVVVTDNERMADDPNPPQPITSTSHVSTLIFFTTPKNSATAFAGYETNLKRPYEPRRLFEPIGE